MAVGSSGSVNNRRTCEDSRPYFTPWVDSIGAIEGLANDFGLDGSATGSYLLC